VQAVALPGEYFPMPHSICMHHHNARPELKHAKFQWWVQKWLRCNEEILQMGGASGVGGWVGGSVWRGGGAVSWKNRCVSWS
jgi:hypothetical protein